MVEKIKVYGNQRIKGVVPISGAKNSALPLLAASLLPENGLKLSNVPNLLDTTTMLELLESLGISYTKQKDDQYSNTIEFKTDSVNNFTAPYDIVKKMRASILVLGPLLARFGRATVSLPGGCAIGVRPINLHIAALEKMGAKIILEDGYLHASAATLHGEDITFSTPTVTGTENILMAATLANGTTILRNAAQEPEIVDLANCLIGMGANIVGHGTDTIMIEGVSRLCSTEYKVLPDRIEAGTYAIAAGITNGSVDLIGGDFISLLPAFVEKMTESGMIFTSIENGVRVESCGEIRPIHVNTEPFPGFPTDLQAQTMSMLCVAGGESSITENIWENRFMHVSELSRMGANISISGSKAIINGVGKLVGAPVVATDLRASFGLLLAAMVASGDSYIEKVYHLDRGYCGAEEKLSACGVVIERIME